MEIMKNMIDRLHHQAQFAITKYLKNYLSRYSPSASATWLGVQMHGAMPIFLLTADGSLKLECSVLIYLRVEA
jgi:hypothetical protein